MDCSIGFFSTTEEALFKDLTEKAPVEFINLEEPEELEPQPEQQQKAKEKEKEKEKGKKGTKDRKKKDKEGEAFAIQASQANVSTRSASKAVAEASTAGAITGGDSPFVAPSILTPAPSQSGGNLPNVALRKRKILAPDGNVTSSESYSISTFIKNVDMTELIEIHMATKLHHPTYRHIQEFLAKVCPYILISLIY